MSQLYKEENMKKLISCLIVFTILVSCMCFVRADEYEYIPNTVGKSDVSYSLLSAFENDYSGYESTLDVYEDKNVRVIKRNGEPTASTDFCLYKWGHMVDVDGNYIPLETSNYIVIEYYYDTPDKNPALEGNRMYWIQGRITPADNLGEIIEFGWGHKIYSNPMVANEWSTLVFPLIEDKNYSDGQVKYSLQGLHYLHQIKLFPLEKHMGPDDALYIGDITIQSWDPADGVPETTRTLSFFNSESDYESGAKPISEIKAKDLEEVTIPAFSGKAPENTEFVCWVNTFNGKEMKVGSTYKINSGDDVEFFPVFGFKFKPGSVTSAFINGYPDGTFRPQNNVTRAEACKIIASIINPDGKAMEKTAFSDVSESDWYYGAVTTLESFGALDIFEEKFSADTPITRAELVQIIYIISARDGQNKKITVFNDVDTKEACFDAVMHSAAYGIITGYEDKTFKPDANITRAETVTVINRLIGRVFNEKAESASKFSDIEGHWAKGQVIASASVEADGFFGAASADEKEYVLSGTSAKDYIMGLHDQSAHLSGDAIRRGIDTVSEQMKKDILSTSNTEEYYGDKMTGLKWYVSEKNGDDANDGRSPETAVKTIAGLNAKIRFGGKGTAILFERGGLYRGKIVMSQGYIYGAYGEGEKPIITTAKKNYADPALWEETDVPNVYKLTESTYNIGIICFDHGLFDHGNYDALYGKNRIYGSNISSYDSLLEDLEFFSCDRVLYLRSDKGNPGERFKSIEMGDRTDIFDGNGNDVIIDNISMKYTGAHGVGSGSCKNLTVTNCEFSWLGGSLLGNYGETTTQYGNAVEIYGDCNGYYVKNNWMYQIYDTAITHQGINYQMHHIEYEENLMEYCHWGIECWTRAEGGSPAMSDYNSRFNVLRNGGYGWGSIVTKRQDSARLYSFSTVEGKNSDMYCEYTVIDRCSGYLLDIAKTSSEQFYSNIYVQDEGHVLGGLKGVHTNAAESGAKLIAEKLGDDNCVFVLIEND